ncbi:hypothetical protein C2E23DRAFT_836561 [Lenzites betulinus]|nr:hypothetical protein C2E23DRAFT_836561 [Lenzites betulinus]
MLVHHATSSTCGGVYQFDAAPQDRRSHLGGTLGDAGLWATRDSGRRGTLGDLALWGTWHSGRRGTHSNRRVGGYRTASASHD